MGSSLRTLVIHTLIYTAGMQLVDEAVLVGIVQKVLELICVAWGVCLVIIALLSKRRVVTDVVDGRMDTATADALNIHQRFSDFLGEPTRPEEQQQLVHTTNTSSSTPHQDGSALVAWNTEDTYHHYGVLT
eukprot:scaffold79711_cov77-Cyclotella_meneghiniana.AAC.3